MKTVLAAATMTLALTACASAALQTRGTTALHAGTWGGEGIRIDVTDAGARFEFDCATGDIPKPLRADAKGVANADGTYTLEPRGAVRRGDPPNRRAARYSAKVAGDVLTLTITIADSVETIGPFTATLGAESRLHKCR